MISYEPLKRTMKAKNITTYTLIYKYGFSPNTIHNLKKNNSITLHTMEKLCKILNCTANDVVEFLDDEENV